MADAPSQTRMPRLPARRRRPRAQGAFSNRSSEDSRGLGEFHAKASHARAERSFSALGEPLHGVFAFPNGFGHTEQCSAREYRVFTHARSIQAGPMLLALNASGGRGFSLQFLECDVRLLLTAT